MRTHTRRLVLVMASTLTITSMRALRLFWMAKADPDALLHQYGTLVNSNIRFAIPEISIRGGRMRNVEEKVSHTWCQQFDRSLYLTLCTWSPENARRVCDPIL